MRAGRLAALAWFLIPAAFVGPGTVTTCAYAGARARLELLWVLVLAGAACFVLQEAVARLTREGGVALGGALRRSFPRAPVAEVVVAAVVFGCAAFQAGNVAGAAAGLEIALGVPVAAGALAVGAGAGLVLFGTSLRRATRVLGVLVLAMGIAFFATAALLRPDPAALLRGALVPRVPELEPAGTGGAALLLLGLAGTTVVPYNLFLGSRIAAGPRAGGDRSMLALAILAGVLVSGAIVVTGSAVKGTFDLPSLAAVLEARLGEWARPAFGIGLFAAGFTSAVTAPLAAAAAVDGLAAAPGAAGARRFRITWAAVLLFGTTMGVLGLAPVPLILLAQALNGLVLPLAAIALLLAMNDPRALPPHARNGLLGNAALAAVCLLAAVLGGNAAWRAGEALFGAF